MERTNRCGVNVVLSSMLILAFPCLCLTINLKNGFPMFDPAKFHIEIFKSEFLRKINLTHRPYMQYSPSKRKENIFGKIFTNEAAEVPVTTAKPGGENYYAEIKDVVSLSEAPTNIANDNIIQFRVVRDAQGRKLEVTSANLLVKVKYRRKKVKGQRRKLNKRRKVSIILSTVTEAGKRNQTIAAIKNVKIRKTTWFKLKLPEIFIQKILDSEQELIRLHIKCKGCKKGVKLVLVRGSRRRRKSFRKRPRRKQRGLSRTRPFLILHTKLKTYLRSKRRVRNCGNNETSACCKMNIVFNFAEFGWDDWILSPAQFTTGVCKGECTRRRRNSRSDPEEDENSRNRTSPTRTCKPTKQKPLRIIYQMDDHTIIRSALPNMITTRCGCRT